MWGLEFETDTDGFSDQEIVAKTLWGEARGEGHEGMQAVCNVIQNRVNSGIYWWGSTFRTVCLASFQFSCWLSGDPNRAKLLAVTQDDPQYADAISIASESMAGNLPDITGGATSYYANSMPEPPSWAEGLSPTAVIGNQSFFKT